MALGTDERPTSGRWRRARPAPREGAEGREPQARRRTPREGTLRLGRIALWVMLGFLLLRGVGDVLGGSGAEETRAANPAAGWPNAEAEAAVLDFTRRYLTYSPGEDELHTAAVAPYLAPDLEDGAGFEVPSKGRDQTVGQVAVAQVRSLAPDRALVEVSAAVYNSTVSTRRLVVAIARDGRGRVTVHDYPALSAPQARGTVEVDEPPELREPERAQVEATLERFFPPYLGGQAEALSYLAPAGVEARALNVPYGLLEIERIGDLGETRDGRRIVVARVRARDRETRAEQLLSFHLRLVRRDRFYVEAVNEEI